MEDGIIYIVFSENEIAAGSQGVLTFPIEINALIDYTLPSSLYYTKDSYGLKMLPIRVICEAFGYEVNWDDSLRSIEISKENTSVLFNIGINEYIINDESRALEFGPEIRDGKAYVPISFFGDILTIAYSTDLKGTITFTMLIPENSIRNKNIDNY